MRRMPSATRPARTPEEPPAPDNLSVHCLATRGGPASRGASGEDPRVARGLSAKVVRATRMGERDWRNFVLIRPGWLRVLVAVGSEAVLTIVYYEYVFQQSLLLELYGLTYLGVGPLFLLACGVFLESARMLHADSDGIWLGG